MGVLIPEDQLKEISSLVKENNRMLKAMRRDAFIGGVFHVIWWVIILVVVPYVTWIFLEPYVSALTDAYNSAQAQSAEASEAFSKLEELSKDLNLQSIFDRLTGSGSQATE